MRITKVKLDNYVCFYDAPEFELGSGINFVIGKNNSGKTALLDALTPGVVREPHRSKLTVPARDAAMTTDSHTMHTVSFNYELNDIRQYIRQSDPRGIEVPLLVHFPFLETRRSSNDYTQSESDVVTNYVEKLLRFGIVAEVTFRSAQQQHIRAQFLLQKEKPVDLPREIRTLRVTRAEDGKYRWWLGSASFFNIDQYGSEWSSKVEANRDNTFRFNSERITSARLPQTPMLKLNSDASNLVQVIDTLQSCKLGRFLKYLKAVQRVLPDIINLRTVPDRDDGDAQITLVVDYLCADEERDDLGVSLDKCGTGVSQILAILYVVVYYGKDAPNVVIIDEPNSFLHPGAVRELLRIFEDNDHHQYVIATHSPTAIMSVEKKRILLVEHEDMVSTVKSVAVDDNAPLEAALSELGTRRSDIFGMDAVVWVEGKTDAACFKLILDKAGGLPFGTNIMELVNTGDIEDKKHARLAVNIYRTLSGGVGLLPSALGFVFDGDKEGSHGDIELETGTQVKYLPRQTYENYLLEFPSLIAGLLNEKHEGKSQPYTESQIQKWISDNCRKDKYYRGDAKYDPSTWTRNIDGARFISAMFQELTGKQRPYNKAKFGPILTKRILAKAPDHFQEIVDILKPLLDPDQSEDKPART